MSITSKIKFHFINKINEILHKVCIVYVMDNEIMLNMVFISPIHKQIDETTKNYSLRYNLSICLHKKMNI